MIRHTFTLLDGIGEKTEKRLWQSGLVTWNDFIETDYLPCFSPVRAEFYRDLLLGFKYELDTGNSSVFKECLSSTEHWRLFEQFSNSAICLDIETNGYAPGRGGEITIVGLYNGQDYEVLISGENFDKDYLMERISQYKILITFFGSSFDIPFLTRVFPGFNINIPHFDLCHAARRLGLKGGLKKIEQYFSLKRPEEIQGINGYDAVILWRRWLRGSHRSLDLLINYNKEDTVNLFYIAEKLYSALKASTGIYKYYHGK